MCFFYYFCLLIITTNVIIKANVMIVTPINEKYNMYIVNISACISTIRLTSSCRRQTTSAYSHFLCQSFYNIIFTLSISFIFKFRDFFTFSRKTLIVSRFLVYFYIKNLFFIFQSSLNKPIINRLFALCNYFLEQRKLAIIWRSFLYILPFFYSYLGIF